MASGRAEAAAPRVAELEQELRRLAEELSRCQEKNCTLWTAGLSCFDPFVGQGGMYCLTHDLEDMQIFSYLSMVSQDLKSITKSFQAELLR